MNKSKKYLFYPYTDQSYAVVKAMIQLNINVDIIASKGSGYVGKPIGYAVNRSNPAQTVKSIEEVDIKNYDVLVLPENFDYTHYQNEIEMLLDKVKYHKLQIYCTNKEWLFKEDFKDILIKNINTTDDILEHMNKTKELNNSLLFQSQVPVVYIGQLLESNDSFDIALQLKIALEKRGYACALVSENKDGMFFGTLLYPPAFMGKELTIEEQIVSFNHWIQAIDQIYRPDIILLDVPKGIMQYSRSLYNSFGIYGQMMATTIPPDFLILTVTKDNIENIQLGTINKHVEGKLGKTVDVFYMINSMFNILPNMNIKPDKPLYINEEKVNKILNSIPKDYKEQFMDLSLNQEIERLVEILINKFS